MYKNRLDRIPFKRSLWSKIKDFFAACLVVVIGVTVPCLMVLAACTPLIVGTIVVVLVLRFMGVLQ